MIVKVIDIYSKLQAVPIDIKLVAGESGLSNLVKWFHMVEGRDIPDFLEGEELVFTTGIALKEQNVTLFEIVKGCLLHGASAMVVNIGPYIESIDQDIIDFCNENQFPLFVCPWDVYMANIAKIISKEILRQQERQNELISCFKNAICFPSQQELYAPGLQRYDYEMEWKYCIGIIKVESYGNKDVSRDELRRLRKTMENILAFHAPQTVTFRLNDDIVLCFANLSEDNIHLIMNRIMDQISKTIKEKYTMYAGIGRNTLSVRCLHKTYHIALKVARLQEKLKRSYEVLSYRDMGFSKLFLAMDDQEIMKEYYDSILLPLIEYDKMNNSDYVDFLDLFFEEGCKVNDVAKRLFMHRNSINYKLKKIEDILDCDLNDFNTRTQLLIALKLRWLL